MTSARLFFKRFKAESRFHFETFSWVVPKLYWFYILGPYAFFMIAFYREIWDNPHEYWPVDWPFTILLGLGLLLLSFGCFRSYLFQADLLYVVQNKKLVKGLRLYGFFSSLILSLLQISAVVVLLLPFLRGGESLELASISSLALLLLAYRMLSMFFRHRFVSHWLGNLLGVLLFVGTLFLYGQDYIFLGALSLIGIMIAFVCYLQKLESNEGFTEEILVELKERHKFIGLIFFVSSFKTDGIPKFERSDLSKSNRPQLLFTNSKRIFKERTDENAFLEFSLKSFIRNPNYRQSYLMILGVPAVLLLFLPPIVQIILLVVMLIVLWMFASGVFDKIISHEFFYLVPVNKELQKEVNSRFCAYLVMPGVGLIAFVWLLLMFL